MPPETVDAFDERLVRSRLATMFKWDKAGLRRASHVNGLIESVDVEEALRAAARASGLNPLEVSCVVHRVAGGKTRENTAALIKNPGTGKSPSEKTVSRATASGVRKLTAWLNGARSFSPEDYVSEDPGEGLTNVPSSPQDGAG